MRTLLLRGTQVSVKSTWIAENNLGLHTFKM